MSLATRCTSCATVFRVVQDQLKVSEGWVRCGRCDTVFNALEHLSDLERDGLPADPATGAPASHDSLPDLPSDAVDKPPLADAFDALLRERSADRDPQQRLPAAAPEAEAAPVHHELLLDVPGAELPPPLPEVTEDDGKPPGFVRAAERDARWQRPRVRWALRGVAALLMGGLALQAAHHFRDSLAARWPQALPALQAWCGALGCRIEPLRRIGDVTVENTALVPGAAGVDSVALSVTLRNRGRLPVALPSVDLSLTDSNGQLVSRRALAPADFSVSGTRPASPLLRPDTDTRLQATLTTAQRVVGYTVEVFYP